MDGVAVLILRVLLIHVLLLVLGFLLLVLVLFLFEGGFALLSAVLVFSESLFTLELEVSNVVSAVADVLHAQV